VHIEHNGNTLTFVNRSGKQSAGTWTSPTQISAYGETVTIGSGTSTGELIWSDGTIWSEALSISGTDNGSGMTTIEAVPSKILVTDYLTGSGKTVHTVQTGTTNDGPLKSVQGIRVNTAIDWSNGDIWTNFDLDALNAFFLMGTGYP
jgi:hypothetical protein